MFHWKDSYHFIAERNYCKSNFAYQRYKFSKAYISTYMFQVFIRECINSLGFPKVLPHKIEMNMLNLMNEDILNFVQKIFNKVSNVCLTSTKYIPLV